MYKEREREREITLIPLPVPSLAGRRGGRRLCGSCSGRASNRAS